MKEHTNEEKGHHDVAIMVNGREKKVAKGNISFSEVVALAFETSPSMDTMFTVTYRRGNGEKPEGTLVDGENVKVKESMLFNVTATNKS